MEDRKKDHIDLAFTSRIDVSQVDSRFEYEPMLGTHNLVDKKVPFAGKELKLPLWVSSMTGGTQRAATINRNLAQACAEFGMGMGLGSCRILLDHPQHFNDFLVRPILGDDLPLYANMGVCQLEQMLKAKSTDRLSELVEKLKADGLVIHVNPLQEAFQPEGDRLERSPLELLQEYMEMTSLKIIVKEVGQGFGVNSLRELLKLPLEAIEFGALGGTNFSLVELNRSNAIAAEVFRPFINVGHSAEEMTLTINELVEEMSDADMKTRHLIISGGISSLLDGYYLTSISKLPAIYGMGSAFLRHAMGSYEKLHDYVQQVAYGLSLAHNFLKVKHPDQ